MLGKEKYQPRSVRSGSHARMCQQQNRGKSIRAMMGRFGACFLILASTTRLEAGDARNGSWDYGSLASRPRVLSGLSVLYAGIRNRGFLVAPSRVVTTIQHRPIQHSPNPLLQSSQLDG